MEMTDNSKYLKSDFFVNTESKNIKRFVAGTVDESDDEITKATKLYYAVRDGFYYDPYFLDFKQDSLRSNYLLSRRKAYCVEKAIILTAVYRAAGLPARLGFANVKNHIGTEKLEQFLGTNLLVFHGYTEVYLNEKWVKATPAFNKELCQKLNVEPLDFDGLSDSVFQEYNKKGNKYMEYVHDYGTFEDLPYDLFVSELRANYPSLFKSDFYDKKNNTVFFR
jgi:transglutaminase-like putative cysteine protease